ncbi:MAG: hypothetical protein ACJAWL_000829 [Motiliproteus sp.]|jgi:uncharacterized protein YqiB (DUF1249 family)
MSLGLRKRYVPDLCAQQACGESNYAKLMRLLPGFDTVDMHQFQISWQQHRVQVEILVEERFAYTSTVHIAQHQDADWIQMPALIVRLYHDARMAEVVCRKRRSQLRGSYPYPNAKMHQPDEKAQLNRYLSEWLNQCLAQGHTSQAVARV